MVGCENVEPVMLCNLKRLFFVGFAALVLFCQHLSLGYCSHAGAFFVTECPCAEEEGHCCCHDHDAEEPCERDGSCPLFLEVELDEFQKNADTYQISSAGHNLDSPAQEVCSHSSLEEVFRFPKRWFSLKDPPPGDQVSLLIRYSVALI